MKLEETALRVLIKQKLFFEELLLPILHPDNEDYI